MGDRSTKVGASSSTPLLSHTFPWHLTNWSWRRRLEKEEGHSFFTSQKFPSPPLLLPFLAPVDHEEEEDTFLLHLHATPIDPFSSSSYTSLSFRAFTVRNSPKISSTCSMQNTLLQSATIILEGIETSKGKERGKRRKWEGNKAHRRSRLFSFLFSSFLPRLFRSTFPFFFPSSSSSKHD